MLKFKNYLTEISTGKAIRLARSKNASSPEAVTAVQSARKRLLARAMSSDIDGKSIRAQDIAHNIDKIDREKDVRLDKIIGPEVSKKPGRGDDRPVGDEYKKVFPVASDIQALRDLQDLPRRTESSPNFVDQGYGARPPAFPVILNRAIQANRAASRIRSMGPVGMNNEPTRRELQNVHNHIMRSRLAGAAERMGMNASDVPEFKPIVPLGGQYYQKNTKNKYSKFDKNDPHGPNKPL